MDFKMIPTHTFLGTMATHSYLGSWLLNKMPMLGIPFKDLNYNIKNSRERSVGEIYGDSTTNI
jgi:hypothetical protein